jgi:hypothetical protein
VIPQPSAAPSPLYSSGLCARTAPENNRVIGWRSLALSPPLDRDDACPADLYVGPRFNQPSAWAMKSTGLAIVSSRLIGDDRARPEVGWVPLAMDEPPAPRLPWQLRGTLH